MKSVAFDSELSRRRRKEKDIQVLWSFSNKYKDRMFLIHHLIFQSSILHKIFKISHSGWLILQYNIRQLPLEFQNEKVYIERFEFLRKIIFKTYLWLLRSRKYLLLNALLYNSKLGMVIILVVLTCSELY